MPCSKALEALVAVTIAGKVDVSSMSPGNMTIKAGDPVKISFLADPTKMYRFAEGNFVQDGIGPYPVCAEDFTITFGSKVQGHLGAAPLTYEGLPGSFYFSLMQGRPINDGMWVSQDPVDPLAGFPLVMHGASSAAKFGGSFSLEYKRHSVPSTDLESALGTYGSKGMLKATFDLWNGWVQNTVASITFDSITLAKGA